MKNQEITEQDVESWIDEFKETQKKLEDDYIHLNECLHIYYQQSSHSLKESQEMNAKITNFLLEIKQLEKSRLEVTKKLAKFMKSQQILLRTDRFLLEVQDLLKEHKERLKDELRKMFIRENPSIERSKQLIDELEATMI